MKLSIPIDPMGTVRMTTGMVKRIKYNLYEPGDPKVERVISYLRYKEQVSWAARTHYKGDPLTGPIRLMLTFYMPMPLGWGLKKQIMMEGKPHTKRPDRDNLEKGVCDALNKIVWRDDGQVYAGMTEKRYSRNPRIEVEIIEVQEASA